ncbi:MAG: hypothetical protein ACU833_13845 [Gammaproteobacteria bacterium]
MEVKRELLRNKTAWGWLCIALGLYPMALAEGLIPLAVAEVHAPMWVVFLCGAVFAVGGAMIVFRSDSGINDALAALLLIGMGAVAAWVAFFGPPEGFSGGIPFLPVRYNISIARGLFGFGAFLAFFLAVIALRRFLKSSRLP